MAASTIGSTALIASDASAHNDEWPTDCPIGYKCIPTDQYVEQGKRIDKALAELEAYYEVCPKGPLQCAEQPRRIGWGACIGPTVVFEVEDNNVTIDGSIGATVGLTWRF